MELATETRRPGVLRWALAVGVASFVISILVALPIQAILKEGNPPIERLARQNPGLLMAILVTMPFIETLIGQWLPIAIVGFFTRASVPKILVSSLLFAALHLGNSLSNALIVLLVLGPAFAFTFVRWREVSRWKAYLATSLTHAVHNACAGALILATF